MIINNINIIFNIMRFVRNTKSITMIISNIIFLSCSLISQHNMNYDKMGEWIELSKNHIINITNVFSVDNSIFIYAPNKLLKSDDRGKNWLSTSISFDEYEHVQKIIKFKNHYVLLMNSSKLFSSSNGIYWEINPIEIAMQKTDVLPIFWDICVFNDYLYLSTNFGLFYTNDLKLWQNIICNVSIRKIYVNNNNIIALSEKNCIKSHDGQKWIQTSLQSYVIEDLFFKPKGEIFNATRILTESSLNSKFSLFCMFFGHKTTLAVDFHKNEFYLSNDNQQTWEKHFLMQETVSIIVDKNDNILISNKEGIYIFIKEKSLLKKISSSKFNGNLFLFKDNIMLITNEGIYQLDHY